MPVQNSYINNACAIIKLMPSISMGARIAHRLAKWEDTTNRNQLGLQLGYTLWRDGILHRGRIVPAEAPRAIPWVTQLVPSQTLRDNSDFVSIHDCLVSARTSARSKLALPRITPHGLWIALGYLVQPKKLGTTLESLERDYSSVETLVTTDPAHQVQLLSLSIARFKSEIALLTEAVESSNRMVSFMQQITQMIISGVPDQEFVHGVCEVLYKAAGLQRCIAMMHDQDKNALVAEGRVDTPGQNSWASAANANTDQIIAFLQRPDGSSHLEIPIDPAGQKKAGIEMARKATHLIAIRLRGKTHLGLKVAWRVFKSFGGVFTRGKLVLPEGWTKDQADVAESIFTQCFRTGETLVINDTSKPEHPVSRPLIAMWQSKTFIVAPIKVEGTVVGVFGMDHDQHPKPITPEAQHQVELLVHMANIGFTLRSYTRALENVMGKHLGPKVAKEIISKMLTGRSTELVPQPAVCSVMFTDIVGFTGITKRLKTLGENALRDFLTEYREWLDRFIFEFEGVLDKHIGDAHLAAWGTPVLKHSDDAERSLQAAVAMQREADRFMKESQWGRIFAKRGFPPLQIRIGIDTGEVMAGVFASEHKHEYTVIGDAVNRANRFEGAAGASGIVISQSTFDTLSPIFISRYVRDFNATVKAWITADLGAEAQILQGWQDLKVQDIFEIRRVEIKIGGKMEEAWVYQVKWDRKLEKDGILGRLKGAKDLSPPA